MVSKHKNSGAGNSDIPVIKITGIDYKIQEIKVTDLES